MSVRQPEQILIGIGTINLEITNGPAEEFKQEDTLHCQNVPMIRKMTTDGLHKKIFIYLDYLNNTIREPNTIIAIITHTAVPKL